MKNNDNQNTNTNRQFKIYIRSTNEWVTVSEEVYRAYYRDIVSVMGFASQSSVGHRNFFKYFLFFCSSTSPTSNWE